MIFHGREAQSNGETQYRGFSDGIYYKTNELFSGEDSTIDIVLYVDDWSWLLTDVPVLLR